MPAPRSLVRDRARGTLLGLAVGDALGTTLEFATPAAPPFPSLAEGPHADVTGGGPFDVVPGQVTDDTQMAACLAGALAARGGRYDVSEAAARYRAWTEHAFDVGSLTASALARLERGAAPGEAGFLAWEEAGMAAAGNGSLMRSAPIGVALAADAGARRLAALRDSAVTHYDPRCALACAALDAAVAAGVAGAARARDLLDAAGAELGAAAAAFLDACPPPRAARPDVEARLAAAVDALLEDLDRAQADDPGLYGRDLHLHAHQGFVRVAFRLAFWELLHAPTWRAGVTDAVNRGGDADTNGAIAGALLGALHGERALPEAWRARVLSAVPREDGPLRTLYHPRALLALAP